MTITLTLPDSLVPYLDADVQARNAGRLGTDPEHTAESLVTQHVVVWLEGVQREALRAFAAKYAELTPADRAEVAALLESKQRDRRG